MFALPMSKPRFKSTIFFYQNSPIIKSFLQKNVKFSSAGGFAPTTPKQLPHCEFLATRLLSSESDNDVESVNNDEFLGCSFNQSEPKKKCCCKTD